MQILADAQLALGSKADNFWSKLAIERGSCPQAVVGILAEVSERAQAKIRRETPEFGEIVNSSRRRVPPKLFGGRRSRRGRPPGYTHGS